MKTFRVSESLLSPGKIDRTIVVGEGETLLIEEPTTLGELTIETGGTIAAEPGQDLTLTVDGIEVAIGPGHYAGVVTLTPTTSNHITRQALGLRLTHPFRSAITINDGTYRAEHSVSAAVIEGEVTDRVAQGIVLRSENTGFNGILVGGDSRFDIRRAAIRFSGDGVNDFIGRGAAIAIGDRSKAEIADVEVVGQGVVRTPLWIGDAAEVTVKDSTFEALPGELPADTPLSLDPRTMRQAPWILGWSGTNRAVVVTARAQVTLERVTIKAHTWGALAVDNPKHVRIIVRDSDLSAGGYGALGVGDTTITLINTTISVGVDGLFVLPPASMVLEGSTIVSKRRGITVEGALGGGGSVVLKDCKVSAGEAAIQLKSASTDLSIIDTRLESGQGRLIETFLNDDPLTANGVMKDPVPDYDGIQENPPPIGTITNIEIVRSELHGDILHGDTDGRQVNLRLEDTSLTGAISTSRTDHARGPDGEALGLDTPHLIDLIGVVSHTPGEATGKFGLTLALTGRSRWTVARTSHLTHLVIGDASTIAPAEGLRLTLEVDRQEVPLRAGRYDGSITLRVFPAH